MRSVLRSVLESLRALLSLCKIFPCLKQRVLPFWFLAKRLVGSCCDGQLWRSANKPQFRADEQADIDKEGLSNYGSSTLVCSSPLPQVLSPTPSGGVEQAVSPDIALQSFHVGGNDGPVSQVAMHLPAGDSRPSSRSSTHKGRQPKIHGPSPVASRNPSPAHQSIITVTLPQGSGIHHGSTHTTNAIPQGVARRPMSSMSSRRYYKKTFVNRREYSYQITAQTRSFERQGVPAEWTACVHPEGALYYHHEKRNIFTEANLSDPTILGYIDACSQVIDHEAGHLRGEGSNVELVLDIDFDGTTSSSADEVPECSYYLADNEHRTIFWVEDRDAESVILEVGGEMCDSHLALELESRYWRRLTDIDHILNEGCARSHFELFPCHREVPDLLYRETVGILTHACMDSLMGQFSLSPLSTEDTQAMIGLVNNVPTAGGRGGYSASLIGRILKMFYHARFLNYHGHYGARLARNQSIYDEKHSRSWLMIIFSYALFSVPMEHLNNLEKRVWVDRIVIQPVWLPYITKLTEEWNVLVLMATVMLTCNVSFLAIQSVDNSGSLRSGAQIGSYASTVLSMGSMILGLFLVRRHRGLIPEHGGVDTITSFLASKEHAGWGLEPLALVYSLPYALLMWAMIAFLFSLSCLFFDYSTTFDANSLRARLPIAFISTGVLALVTLAIYVGRDDEEHDRRVQEGLWELWQWIKSKSRCHIPEWHITRWPNFVDKFRKTRRPEGAATA